MRRVLRTFGAGACAAMVVTGCGAARDIRDAAEGVRNAEENARELEARLARGKELTYTATYDVRNRDGEISQVRIAQKPPKSSYTQGDTQLIDDGQRVVNCTRQGGSDECVEVGPHTDAGIYGVGAGFNFAFNPASFLGLYTTAAIVPGVEAGTSTREVGGQMSECVSVRITRGTDAGKSFEGCTTEDGVFTYSDDGEGNVVTLTSFERSADDALFTPPSRVRTQQDILDDATSTTGRATSTSRSSTSSSSSTSRSTTSTTDSTGGRTTTTT